jgi:hypothetical protein
MIIEIISKYKSVAFSTSSIKRLMDLCIDEGIIFSKNKYKENIYVTWHLGSDIGIIVFQEEYKEYQFFSRRRIEWDNYEDWNSYEIIDFDKLIREEKLKEIIEK